MNLSEKNLKNGLDGSKSVAFSEDNRKHHSPSTRE